MLWLGSVGTDAFHEIIGRDRAKQSVRMSFATPPKPGDACLNVLQGIVALLNQHSAEPSVVFFLCPKSKNYDSVLHFHHCQTGHPANASLFAEISAKLVP